MQVRFEDVTLKFGDKTVLDKINFTLPSSELISFLGPSGSGKSTTLYLISGLLDATEGKIYFDDVDVTNLDPVKRGVGLVFQNYALYPHLTVLENIMFPLKMAKMNKKERRRIATEMAELTKIGDQLDKYPRQLSGGQQQRVAISRALAKSPSILLMDEPLSNLDARLRIEMREEIRRIQKETGVTTVFVTHDQEEALSIADHVMVLDDGEIQQMTDPVTLYEDPKNIFIAKFIGSPIINVFGKESSSINKNHRYYKKDWFQFGIRPEHLVVGDEENHLLSSTVERIERVGKDITIHLINGLEKFIVSDVDVEGMSVGDTLYFDADEAHALYFDIEGNRLEGRDIE
ncbi:ABC transporter ATP-binding protein [Aerococcaceae bacterium DSM 111021]|nr:ABC transporter ATP-binding protein [Aerococcaceae bacterium DSM 111021]